MERIGIAASRMAQGNLIAYNLFVVLIASLCALFIFLICGFVILAALFLIFTLFLFLMPGVFEGVWLGLVKICLVGLGLFVGLLNMWAIIRNVRLIRKKT